MRDFWQTHGVMLQQTNGPGTFKHTCLAAMKRLHEDIAGERDEQILHRKILDILAQQSTYMMQFECCLDEFNGYLAELRLLDCLIQHGI